MRNGDGVRQNGLVSADLDALHEVTDERLALGERPLLQELPEVRHVLLDLLGGGKFHSALLKLAGSGLKHTAYDKLMAMAQIDDNGALYWGGGGLPIEPYSEDRRTARHRNQSAAIETTG